MPEIMAITNNITVVLMSQHSIVARKCRAQRKVCNSINEVWQDCGTCTRDKKHNSSGGIESNLTPDSRLEGGVWGQHANTEVEKYAMSLARCCKMVALAAGTKNELFDSKKSNFLPYIWFPSYVES